MLIWFVVLSDGVGRHRSLRRDAVTNTKDFAVAGRSLPFPVVMATVFATWFGAESIFGISGSFIRTDWRHRRRTLRLDGVPDPRRHRTSYLYKLNIITLGDFYRARYNRSVEVPTTLCIVVSYLGWVAAQTKALGLLFNVVSDNAIGVEAGMVLGTVIVLSPTPSSAACCRWPCSISCRWW